MKTTYLLALVLCALLTACASTSTHRGLAADNPASFALGKHPLYGNNLQSLQTIIQTYGSGSTGYNANAKPVATFDWDNTVMKNLPTISVEKRLGKRLLIRIRSFLLTHGSLKYSQVIPRNKCGILLAKQRAST